MADLFKLNVYTVGGIGTIYLNPSDPNGLYEEGAEIEIGIVEEFGFTFSAWKIGGVTVSTSDVFTYTMPDQDIFIYAEFVGLPDPGINYGLKYYSEFKPQQSNSCTRLEIYAKDWVDPAERREIGNVVYSFGNRGSNVLDTVIGSSVDFELAVLETDDFEEFLNADPRYFQVKYYQFYGEVNQIEWIGYLKTDFIERPYLGTNYLMQCTASDILQTLDAFKFNYNFLSATSGITYIAAILAQTVQTPLNISECVQVFETRMNDYEGLFEQFNINQGRFFDEGQAFFVSENGQYFNDSFDLKTVLTYLLKSFVARIFQWNGQYYITRLNEFVKDNLIFNNYDGYGAFVDTDVIDNTTQELVCLDVNNGVLSGELSYNKFFAKLNLGYLDYPEKNTIITDNFDDWYSISNGVYKLTNWQYVKCVPFDGERARSIARVELITEANSSNDHFPLIWGTANGFTDTNLSYLEINSLSQGASTAIAIEDANTITVGATFWTKNRGSDDPLIPPAGSHYLAIQVQIGDYYLYEVSENVYDWTLTPSLCSWEVTTNRVDNTIEITGLSVPENGEVYLRLCQLITVSGTQHRYTIGWKQAYVNLERNEALANAEIEKIGTIETQFPNAFEMYETYIGDAKSSLSVSAIKLIGVSGQPVSELWSRDGVEAIELLDYVIDEIADLYGKNNYRFYLDYYAEIDPTKRIDIGSAKYFVNSFIFDSSASKWELDLFRLDEIPS